MSIVDALEREAALDPLRSFCISAPAGSGKTELLIRRYLSLLPRVRSPEQILAITFTRKAAAEMRERVLQALQTAAEEAPCSSEHQLRTRELALAALAADAEHGWHLLANSARLNIRTIDGFCATLTRQMPVLSTFGAQASPVDDARPLYAEAVSELFALVNENHPVAADLARLMLHFDNHWDRLSELLQNLLARRNQWLGYMGLRRSPEAAEQQLRAVLIDSIRDSLSRLQRLFGPYLGELYALQCYAAAHLQQPEPEAAPGVELTDLDGWRNLRRLLLTADGKSWRARVDKRQGFPAGKGEAAAMKARLSEVIAALAEQDQRRLALLEVDLMPQPEPSGEPSARDDNWQLVLSLSHVLPVLAAQLLLVFQRRGAVDHNQVAESALLALGQDDAPTDLALRLDYRIEHILVDEFQDTASTQYELMHRLTRGWGEHNEANPAAPRTFLIVGDGMQSIYGFRDANVGLFLRARNQGFNGVVPTYLELRSNFRSQAGVVAWVNQTFAQVFPAEDDISRGEVRFSTAVAVKPALPEPAVTVAVFHGDNDRAAEVEAVCDRIATLLANEDDSRIAILGRSRPQLQGFVAGLRSRGISFAAQDMDRLQHSPVVLDLLLLVRALANRADRVAWWGLLRAPWCGLTLADLQVIALAGGSQPFQDLPVLLSEPHLHASLSADGRDRCRHLLAVLARAEERRDRASQRAWLEQIWLDLGGPATVADKAALADAEQFFRLLEQGELQGRILDVVWLEAALERLYADAGGDGARVEVMTLHKAKGLEFDHVFIPALARGAASDSRALLLWDEYSDGQGRGGFMMAADDHSDRGTPGLYNYLGARRKRKQWLENTRLLYVGATRAIRSLHLSASLQMDESSGELKAPGQQTLLACIWPAVAQEVRVVEAPPALFDRDIASTAPLLVRLQKPAVGSLSDREVVAAGAALTSGPPSSAQNHLERVAGTVVHRVLELLASQSVLPAAPDAALLDTCRWLLAAERLTDEDLAQALTRVQDSLERTLADATGRWLLRADHPHSACELALTRIDSEGEVQDLVVDRTFVDAETGKRWIIDYKTSEPSAGVELESFLAEEARRYRGQLQSYCDAMAALGSEPICCALYFTALGRLFSLDIPAA